MFENSRDTAAPAETPANRSAHPGAILPGAQQLREWVRAAQPNARLVYAHGVQWEHSSRSDVRDQVLKLQKLGLATSHFVRGRLGEPDRHLLQRSQRPYLKGMQL
jgi:hypothetical protein